MNWTCKLSSKGQMTVPQQVRENLGVKAGDQIDIVIEKGLVQLRPHRSEENPFLEFIGALPMEQSAVQWVRSLRDDIPDASKY
jgi:AbrB family looped-hinge helix DNA binding protein